MKENTTKIVLDEGRRMMIKLYRECQAHNKTVLLDETRNDTFCPVVFDGYLCWGPTKHNSTEIKSCPSHVIGFNGNLMASKVCLENGSWWRHPDSNRVWSDYTTCINHIDLNSRQLINDIYYYGYILSLFTLIISLIIFIGFRSLKCTRIRIHTHLFMSLAFNCIAWILWYKLVIGSNVIQENPEWCVVLHILTQYCMICNYFWMFCEGIHLHLVLVVVFIKEYIAMRIFFAIGWILPMIFVTIYGVLRWRNPEESQLCWVEESKFMWILKIPVIFILICSTVFLVNIVRVLITKLHPKSVKPAPLAIKKAVRATLILIPLFGLQYILLPFRPEDGSTLDVPYQLLSSILISLQGFCVSFLFCFFNQEVLHAVTCFFHSLCPRIFTSYYRESYCVPAATTTRDMVV